MELTNENYYTADADMEYMSVSQFKDFHGSYGITGCERTAMMRLRGEYPLKTGTPLLVGGYVDAWFEGTLDKYKEEHPEMFKKGGELKADFVRADAIIERVQKDPMFMYYMSGEKQKIMTGTIDGIEWKIKIDSLLPDTIVAHREQSDERSPHERRHLSEKASQTIKRRCAARTQRLLFFIQLSSSPMA